LNNGSWKEERTKDKIEGLEGKDEETSEEKMYLGVRRAQMRDTLFPSPSL
jgi:hypothetical protein